MNDKQLERVLGRLAEGLVPAEMDLWPAIQVRFRKSKTHSQKGDSSMNTHVTQNRRLRLVSAFMLALLMVTTLFFVTPQGRALAEEIFNFFRCAPSDTLPIQSWQLTPLPTLGSSTPTPDPGSIIDANQTVQAVEKQAGFHVLEPAYLPEILSFSGASFDPKLRIARIFFRYVETNGLVLSEDPYQIRAECDLCDVVGASAAVETVQIGEVTGEYAEGVWNLTDNGPVWMNNPYLKRMRWKANGIAFELLYMGPPDTVTKEDMITIAESLK